MPNKQVRIIGGKWRGRKLRFDGSADLRPTLSRARETLFNWLAPHVQDTRCIDLYAGSGAIGIEARSRGAAEVVLIDNNRRTVQQLRQQLQTLADDGLRVQQTDALRFLKTTPERWDILFVDPPFNSTLLAQTLALTTDDRFADALIYWESRTPLEILPDHLFAYKVARAGDCHFGLLARRGGTLDIRE